MLNREYYIRDINIKNQLEDFIAFFRIVDSDSIEEYMNKTNMDKSDFITYLSNIKKHLITKKDNEIYGYVIDKYISIIDEIINYK
jgi:hypothetical protein